MYRDCEIFQLKNYMNQVFEKLQDEITTLKSKIPDNNLPVYLQDFTSSFSNATGTFDYTTAGLIPSNEKLQRLLTMEFSGSISEIENYPIVFVFDFYEIQANFTQYNIILEGFINGFFTWGGESILSVNTYWDFKYVDGKLYIIQQAELPVDTVPIEYYFQLSIKDDVNFPTPLTSC